MSWLGKLFGGKSSGTSRSERHESLAKIREQAYSELFGATPTRIYRPAELFKKPDEHFWIDVVVFTLATETRDFEVAVTSGMSDQRMVEPRAPHDGKRRELIQYFPRCTVEHARRLHDMAWLPLFDRFYLDCYNTIEWPHAAVGGTPWKNAFFLGPLLRSHRDFTMEVEGDSVSLLWHVPISDAELAYKKEQGADALLDRMEAVDLPWVFDESERPALI